MKNKGRAKDLNKSKVGKNVYVALSELDAGELPDQDWLEKNPVVKEHPLLVDKVDFVYRAFAASPDAEPADDILDTIQKIAKHAQKIITVIGCGGDRDKAKRPIMAKVACSKSDMVILTSDNPRSENPATILEDMEKGVPESDSQKVLVISDRKQAIKTACKFAETGAIILVAGKGHEKYQEIKGEKFPFDDKQTLINELY